MAGAALLDQTSQQSTRLLKLKGQTCAPMHLEFWPKPVWSMKVDEPGTLRQTRRNQPTEDIINSIKNLCAEAKAKRPHIKVPPLSAAARCPSEIFELVLLLPDAPFLKSSKTSIPCTWAGTAVPLLGLPLAKSSYPAVPLCLMFRQRWPCRLVRLGLRAVRRRVLTIY